MVTQVHTEDPRVKRTRGLLQTAFMELLLERGFQAMTVGDIAERATVNRVTFYAHFADKYAMLDSVIREDFQRRLEGKLLAGAPLTTRNLRTLAVVVIELLGQVNGHCRPGDKQVEPLFETALQRAIYEYLLRWLAESAPPAVTDRTPHEITAAVVSWALFGTAMQRSRERSDESPDVLAGQVIAVLTSGVLLAETRGAPPAPRAMSPRRS